MADSAARKLTDTELHLLRLVVKGRGHEGWAPVPQRLSSFQWGLIREVLRAAALTKGQP